MTMAPGTAAFYDHWAVAGQEAERSAMSRHFEAVFAPGARVLDVGCGKGRDVVALLDMGFDAFGVEPHDAMRARALARDPRMQGRVANAALPTLGRPFGGGFDAVACSAVLMHLAPEALPASLAALAAVLQPRGRVLMALPQMLAQQLVEGRDPDGRDFANHAPERVQQLFEQLGLALLRRDEIPTPSTDTRWRVLLFERQT
ncbi:MAG: class I SAM-dependent methyltransferase [Vitreoscilla sp.]